MDCMRGLKNILAGLVHKYHWIGVLRALSIYNSPAREIYCYAIKGKTMLSEIKLKNGLKIKMGEPSDIITIHEIFCRNDYPVTGREKVILDLGANIGVSALFFLSKCENAKILSFEPNPRNFQLFEKNTSKFKDRVKLVKAAVVPFYEDYVEFSRFSSSRYGGVGLEGGEKIRVPAKNINTILSQVIDEFGSIDLLKIDIESLEKETLNSIEKRYFKYIKKIYIELPYETPLALNGFRIHIQGQVHQLVQESKLSYEQEI